MKYYPILAHPQAATQYFLKHQDIFVGWYISSKDTQEILKNLLKNNVQKIEPVKASAMTPIFKHTKEPNICYEISCSLLSPTTSKILGQIFNGRFSAPPLFAATTDGSGFELGQYTNQLLVHKLQVTIKLN